MKKGFRKYIGRVIALVLLIGAAAYIVFSPDMRVSRIAVTGNDRVGRDEIAELLPFSIGDHMLTIPMRKTKALLESDPRIAWADLRRKPSGLVEIFIGEHYPSLLLSADRIWGLTDSGLVLPFDESYDIPNLPVLSCFVPELAVAPFERVDSPLVETGLEFYRTVRDVSPQFLDRISEIHIEEDGEITVILTGDGLVVEFGDCNPELRLLRLASVLEDLGVDRADVSSIDLRYSDQAIVKRIRKPEGKRRG